MLDEFFEIRVAGLKQRMEIGAPAQGPEKLPAKVLFDQLCRIITMIFQISSRCKCRLIIIDITWGVKYLIKEGVADKQRVFGNRNQVAKCRSGSTKIKDDRGTIRINTRGKTTELRTGSPRRLAARNEYTGQASRRITPPR